MARSLARCSDEGSSSQRTAVKEAVDNASCDLANATKPTVNDCSLMDLSMATEDVVKATFLELDEDGDGKIPQEDVAAVIQLLLPTVSIESLFDIFAIADFDGDGYLNYDEFVSFIFLGTDRSCVEEHATLIGGELATDTEMAEVEGIEKVLTMRKEPSCPGMFLVSVAMPLGDRITMLGGMLAHPSVGVYPYREGPAPTIVAAQLARGSGGHLPTPLRRALTRTGIDEAFDLFFIVSDVSKAGFARNSAFNIMYHPWCFPNARSGQTLGGTGWLIGLHVPDGGGVSPEASLTRRRVTPVRGTPARSTPARSTPARNTPDRTTASSTTSRTRDADPLGAPVDCLEPTSVFIHPGAGGALCCSPNNVRVGLRRPSPTPVAVVWSACVRRETGAVKTRRACVCIHWLVAETAAGRLLEAAATEARTLEEFLAAAALQLGADAPPMVAIATAFAEDRR